MIEDKAGSGGVMILCCKASVFAFDEWKIELSSNHRRRACARVTVVVCVSVHGSNLLVYYHTMSSE